jgi:hypothetical protein
MSFAPVGYILSWRVPSVVSLSALRHGVAEIGLDPFALVPDLDAGSQVARTAGKVARSMSRKDSKRLARKVEYEKRQITAESNTGEALHYSRDFAVEFDKTTGEVVTSLGESLATVQQEVLMTRRAMDVTRVVQRVIESAGSDLMPVREQGGAYFVPAGHEVIDKVERVVEGVGGRLSRFACTIGHQDVRKPGRKADATGESVANTIADYLLAQIGDLNKAVAELKESGTRSDARRNRLTTVATLKDRLQNYAGLLGAQSSIIGQALGQAEEALLSKLGPAKDEVAKDADFAEHSTSSVT